MSGTRPARLHVHGLLALAIAGCEAAPNPDSMPDSEAAPASLTRDSAGILVVENPRPAPGSHVGWQVSAEPIVSIGTVEGGDDFQLHRVDDALKLPDGRIVVANAGSHQLLVFDSAGSHLDAWGQRGQGPGDFGGSWGSDGLVTNLFWIEHWPGDSLAVCHGSGQAFNNVFSVWDFRGNHGRMLHLARDSEFSNCRDAIPGGPILASRWIDDRPSPLPEKGMNRRHLEFLLLTDDGSRAAALGRHPGAEIFWYFENHFGDGTGMGLYDPPLQKTLRWAAWGDFVVLAPTDRYELRAYRHDGSLARIVRRENNVRSPTQADIESYREANALTETATMMTDRYNATVDAFPVPEAFPAFTAIEVDTPGYLWVREYNLPEDGDRALWTVFDPEGIAQGFIETPQGLTIHEIGDDYILGKAEDELGVEYVQMWGLDRSGQAQATGLTPPRPDGVPAHPSSPATPASRARIPRPGAGPP